MTAHEKNAVSLDGGMGTAFAIGMGKLGVGLVALGIVLLVAVMACEDLSEGIPTAVPTPSSTQAVETPTPSPAPKAEVTISYRDSRESDTEQIMLYGTVTGVLTYEGDQALPAGSRIRIRVRGPNDRYGAVGLFQSFEKSEQFPLSFAFHCDPCKVNEGQKHTASVEIEGPVDLRRQEMDHWKREFRDTLFLNASKAVVIDEKRFAENIEIPVVPQPTLSGTVTPSKGENIPASASGYVRLLDVSEPGADPTVLSSRLIEAAVAFPKPFSMTYLPEDIDPQGKYVLEIELNRFRGWACRGLYRHRDVNEIITGGNPTHDIQLEIVQVDKWVSDEVAYVTGKVALAAQSLPSRRNLKNPWLLTIRDISKHCTLAEIEVDGSNPGDHGYQRPFNFSIAYDPSHIDPSSSYVIQAYHLVLPSDYRSSWRSITLEGETPIVLNTDNPSSHVEVEVHRWEMRE